jgi:hypothetical protein
MTFWLTAKVLDYCESPSDEPGSKSHCAPKSYTCAVSRRRNSARCESPRKSSFPSVRAGVSGREGCLRERRSSAPRSQGNCASRTAMASAVVSRGATGSGAVGRDVGSRARRARWLYP